MVCIHRLPRTPSTAASAFVQEGFVNTDRRTTSKRIENCFGPQSSHHAMSLAHMHQRVCMQRNAAPSCFRDSKCLIRNSSCGPIKSSRSSRPMKPVGLYGCVIRAKPLTAGDTYMDGTVDVSCICSTVRWCQHVLLQLLKRLLQTRSFRAIPSNASTC